MAVAGLPAAPTIRPMDEVLREANVGPTMVNRAEPIAIDPLTELLPTAVDAARQHLEGKRADWAEANAEPLRRHREQLATFQQASLLDELPGAHREKRRQTRRRHRPGAARPARPAGNRRRSAAAGARRPRTVAGECRMSFESLTNRGEYLSAHYLAEILPTTLKGGLLKQWAERREVGPESRRAPGLRGMRRHYFDAKTELADDDFFDPERLRKQHHGRAEGARLRPAAADRHRRALRPGARGPGRPRRAGHRARHRRRWTAAGRSTPRPPRTRTTPAGCSTRSTLSGTETVETGAKLASLLFAADSPKPRYVLILSGGVITLADRTAWGEGRYLAVSLDTAYARNDDKELDVVAALFGADSLRPPAEGGTEPLADLVAGSRQHAVGVSSELREGLKRLRRAHRQRGPRPDPAGRPPAAAGDGPRRAGQGTGPGGAALPLPDPVPALCRGPPRAGRAAGQRPRSTSRATAWPASVTWSPAGWPPSAEDGYHLYESLDLLFRMVNEGHRPRGGAEVDEKASEGEGLRFEPMQLGPVPAGADEAHRPADPRAGQRPRRRRRPEDRHPAAQQGPLRGAAPADAHQGRQRRRGGFISYAQLGINQLGAVYEGLMSYTGFVATEQLYEVAKNGDPKDGSWMIPASKVDEYDDDVFVYKEDAVHRRPQPGQLPARPVRLPARRPGPADQRLLLHPAVADRGHRPARPEVPARPGRHASPPARELLDWTICEPALGSGAFLNEAINQVAAEYLRRRPERACRSTSTRSSTTSNCSR